jgi:putative nucleotidyltransferase with HDIG domain
LIRITASVCACAAAPPSPGRAGRRFSEAVNRLGFRQIYTLVAAVSGARALSPSQRGYGINAGELWRHSVTAAVAAQLIARRTADDESTVFTAGLLHDIGKIVLAEALEHIYAKLVEESQTQQAALVETEKRLLGVEHAEIGGRLLSRWKFSENLVSAVWFHHRPAAAAPHQRLGKP